MDKISESFDEKLEKVLPKLYAHFKDIYLDNRIYMLEWFLSFFAKTYTFTQWKCLMDYIVFGGEHKFMRLGL